MSVETLDPVKIRKPETVKETKAPRKWQVVLYNKGAAENFCQSCVLSEVFGMSTRAAFRHMSEARATGKSSVFVSGRDVVETKTAEANKARFDTEFCHPPRETISFKAEPA